MCKILKTATILMKGMAEILKNSNFRQQLTMIGREREQEKLLELYKRCQADLVAVYGRRRVGKTFLIEETFHDEFLFMHAGLFLEGLGDKEKLATQLDGFYKSLLLYGSDEKEAPTTWFDAFFYLEKLILKKDNGSKQVVFIDELPWLDTPSSHFLSAFEGFWNSFACGRKNLLVIVCGSAASWIENNLINAHGGLYGRVTYEIKLNPFNLKETQEFLLQKHIPVSPYETAEAYMAVGGMPYYLNYFERGKSVAQNINDIFFKKNSPLRLEYSRLFDVTFSNASLAKRIVELLYKHKIGYSRDDIIKKLGLSDNGNLSQVLNALLASDFLASYTPFALERKRRYYKLIDPYCLFYLSFIAKKDADDNYWNNHYGKAETIIWKGLAFENVCFNHVMQIKDKLGIKGVGSEVLPWYYEEGGDKGQVDMLIKRNDNVLNICEIKFYNDDFAAGIEDFKKSNRRTKMAYSLLPKRFSVHNTLITTFGLVDNEYASTFQNVVTLKDLCKF